MLLQNAPDILHGGPASRSPYLLRCTLDHWPSVSPPASDPIERAHRLQEFRDRPILRNAKPIGLRERDRAAERGGPDAGSLRCECEVLVDDSRRRRFPILLLILTIKLEDEPVKVGPFLGR